MHHSLKVFFPMAHFLQLCEVMGTLSEYISLGSAFHRSFTVICTRANQQFLLAVAFPCRPVHPSLSLLPFYLSPTLSPSSLSCLYLVHYLFFLSSSLSLFIFSSRVSDSIYDLFIMKKPPLRPRQIKAVAY
jgi:hypothetical protein